MFIMIFVDDSIDVANIFLSLYNIAIFILEIFARSKLVVAFELDRFAVEWLSELGSLHGIH